MKLNKNTLLLTGFITLCAASAVPAYTASNDLSLLESLDRGLWQLRGIGGAPSRAAVSSLCLGNSIKLTQIQHGNSDCTRFVVRASPNSVTVSYSCEGQGQGMTTIRKETSKLIQVQSQGIMNNAPFSFSVEGRHSGRC